MRRRDRRAGGGRVGRLLLPASRPDRRTRSRWAAGLRARAVMTGGRREGDRTTEAATAGLRDRGGGAGRGDPHGERRPVHARKTRGGRRSSAARASEPPVRVRPHAHAAGPPGSGEEPRREAHGSPAVASPTEATPPAGIDATIHESVPWPVPDRRPRSAGRAAQGRGWRAADSARAGGPRSPWRSGAYDDGGDEWPMAALPHLWMPPKPLSAASHSARILRSMLRTHAANAPVSPGAGRSRAVPEPVQRGMVNRSRTPHSSISSPVSATAARAAMRRRSTAMATAACARTTATVPA